MSYYGKGNNGRPILLRKYDVTSAVSEVTFDGVFKGDFDWHYLIGVDVDVSSASVDLRAIRRANGSDVTTTLDVMSQKGTDTDSGSDAVVSNDTEAGYFQISPDGTGTDNTRNSNTFIIAYVANPSHMPISWGRIRSLGTGLNGFQSNSAPWWYEKTQQLVGSTGFDGVRIYATSGNISNGTFFIYGMA